MHEVHYAMVIILAMGMGCSRRPSASAIMRPARSDGSIRREGIRPIWGYMLALLVGLAIVAIFPWISIGFL